MGRVSWVPANRGDHESKQNHGTLLSKAVMTNKSELNNKHSYQSMDVDMHMELNNKENNVDYMVKLYYEKISGG